MMFGDKIVKSTGRSCIRLPIIFGQTLRIVVPNRFQKCQSISVRP